MQHRVFLGFSLVWVLLLMLGCGSSFTQERNDTLLSTELNQSSNLISVDNEEGYRNYEENQTVTSKIKGYLIDSPVEGAGYSCDGNEAFTDSNGTFECLDLPVIFKVGNLTLGRLNSFTVDAKVYPQDLLGLSRDNYSDDRLKLLTRLLQSLDDDGDIEDKITITEDIHHKFSVEQNLTEMSEGDINILLSELDKGFVDECLALEHLGANVSCYRDGGYVVYPTSSTSVTSVAITEEISTPALILPQIEDAPSQVYVKDEEITPLVFENNGSAITSCSVSPALPMGLSIVVDNNTCQIEGTAYEVASETSYIVTGENENGYDLAMVSISIIETEVIETVFEEPLSTSTPALILPQIEDAPSQVYVKDEEITPLVFENNGSAITSCSVSPALPMGLSVVVDNNTCQIEGTAYEVSAETTYDVTGENENGTDVGTVTISVIEETVVEPVSTPTPPELEDKSSQEYIKDEEISPLVFENSGGDVESCSISPDLPSGLSVEVSDGTCQIVGTPEEISENKTYTVTGENGDGSSSASVDISVTEEATAQLGNLANAKVKIYLVEDNGTLTLKWEDNTSSSTSLDEIGKFNLHSNEVEDSSFYIYEIEGGEDWDANDDGVIDENYTPNSGKICSISKGDAIKEAGSSFIVNAFSEILYESVAVELKYSFDANSLEALLNENAKKILKSDLDESGEIDYKDLLIYNPSKNRDDLSDYYRLEHDEIISLIHKGKTPLLDISYKIGSYKIDNGYVYRVKLSKDKTKAYIASYSSGLIILDISDPTNITEIGSFDTDGSAYSVTISSDETKAYIADFDKGIVVLDISDPTNITKLGSYDSDGFAYNITLSQDEKTAYIADASNGVVVIDISDPTNISEIASYDTDGTTYNITLSDDETKAYIADGSSGLLVLNISDLANISEIASFDTIGYAHSVLLSKDKSKAYIADDKNGLVVLDISDLTNITKVGSFDTYGTTYNIYLSDDETKAYIADGTNGLVVLDISNLGDIKQISHFETEGKTMSVALSDDETKAYISDFNNGFVIIDMSSLNNIAEINSINTGGGSSSVIISKDKTKLYMTDGSNGVAIFDISDPTNISKISSFDTAGTAYKIILSEDETKAYVADYFNGIVILDISDPSNIKELTTFSIGGLAISLDLSADESKIYVGNFLQKVSIFDISDLENIEEIGSYDTGETPYDVKLSKDESKLFIARNSKGLIVIDISDLENITEVGSFDTAGFSYDIELSADETKAYIADYSNGLAVLDISDLSNINQIGSFNAGEYTTNIRLSEDETKVYMADSAKLSIVDISDLSNIEELVKIEENFIDVEPSLSDKGIVFGLSLYRLTTLDVGL